MARVGNDVKASSSGIDFAGSLWIMADKIPTDGVVFAYSAYFRSDKPVRFQIWRPVVKGSDDVHRFVGETWVVPSAKNAKEDVSSLVVLMIIVIMIVIIVIKDYVVYDYAK